MVSFLEKKKMNVFRKMGLQVLIRLLKFGMREKYIEKFPTLF